MTFITPKFTETDKKKLMKKKNNGKWATDLKLSKKSEEKTRVLVKIRFYEL
jgi:hypothetical protein